MDILYHIILHHITIAEHTCLKHVSTVWKKQWQPLFFLVAYDIYIYELIDGISRRQQRQQVVGTTHFGHVQKVGSK